MKILKNLINQRKIKKKLIASKVHKYQLNRPKNRKLFIKK